MVKYLYNNMTGCRYKCKEDCLVKYETIDGSENINIFINNNSYNFGYEEDASGTGLNINQGILIKMEIPSWKGYMFILYDTYNNYKIYKLLISYSISNCLPEQAIYNPNIDEDKLIGNLVTTSYSVSSTITITLTD